MAMQVPGENSARCLTKKISESTVRGFKSVYQKEINKMKRKLVETDSADSSDDLGVKELNPSKRGRKKNCIG